MTEHIVADTPTSDRADGTPRDCAKRTGRVVAARGVVLDAQFQDGHLPAVGNAVLVHRADGEPVTAEVQAHLGIDVARFISFAPLTGVSRGSTVEDTGGPVMVPVGNAMLGRVVDVLGRPLDGASLPSTVERRPIHGSPPRLTEQVAITTPFVTGINIQQALLTQSGAAAEAVSKYLPSREAA